MGVLFRGCAVAAMLLAAPAAAQVQPRGFYLEGIGVNIWPELSDLKDSVLSPGANQTLRLENDYGFGGAAGYAFGNGMRAEVETTLRVLDLDAFSGRALGLVAPSAELNGDSTSLPIMLNGYYDLDLGAAVDGLPLYLYVGAGVGYSHFELSNDSVGLKLSDWVFAYQGMAGLRMRISPRLFLRAGYKYFATADAQLGSTEMSYATHNLELGLAWQFGRFVGAPGDAAAPPAPATPVETRPAGLYVEVFGTANATGTAKLDDPRLPSGGTLDFDSKRQMVFDRRAGGGFAAGYAMGGGWRTEFEFVYRNLGHYDLKGGGFGVAGDVGSFPGYTYLVTSAVNGYYDFDVGLAFQGMPIVPYVGAGVGVASVHIESDPYGIDDRDAAVAVQAMLGAKIRIRPHLYARLGYRYVRTSDVELAGTQLHMAVSDVTFGVGWQF